MILEVSIPKTNDIGKGILASSAYALGLFAFQKPLGMPQTTFEPTSPLGTSAEDFARQQALSEWLGKPALTSLILKLGTESVELIECIMTVTQERNIVTTALQGRNGTVKEYISDGDYQIEVKAAILPIRQSVTSKEEAVPDVFSSVEDRYPEDELKQFIQLLQAQESINVGSDFLDLFGVQSAVVKSYTFEQQTHSNRQSFSLTLLSDSPYEIKIKEDAEA